MSHRLYVDEVGTAAFPLHNGVNERYLCLAGVAVDLDHVQTRLVPGFDAIKTDFFPERHRPQSPLVFHRKDLMNANYPFDALRDLAVRERFDARLLTLLEQSEFTLILVLMDKAAHYKKYSNPAHPYHFCMHAMLERYVGWLNDTNRTGDAVAESRGTREDRELREHFAEAVENGTSWSKGTMQRRLSNHTLRVAKKLENEAGLQVADLVAHPCFKRALARRLRQEPPGAFAGKIADAMAPKLRRSACGRHVRGYGLKWFPE